MQTYNFSTLKDAELSTLIAECNQIIDTAVSTALHLAARQMREDARREAGRRAAAETQRQIEAEKLTVTPDKSLSMFRVGSTYDCRSACDHETVFSWTVVKRTSKRLTLRDKQGRVSVRGVKSDSEGEFCYPAGTYSMCPVIRAWRG